MADYIHIEELLDKEGFVITGHLGNSMYPLIELEDKLLLLKTNGSIGKYDIVIYKVKDRYVIHRIIDEKEDEYIIRGDNCINKEYIKKDRILGYLDKIYRGKQEIKITKDINIKYY